MAEPLDPDTLAKGERLLVRASRSRHTVADRAALAKWGFNNLAALLAVARDHARLTALVNKRADDENARLRAEVARLTAKVEELQRALWSVSAEAGDTDGP
jgi:uncharacterized membrane protein YccC